MIERRGVEISTAHAREWHAALVELVAGSELRVAAIMAALYDVQRDRSNK